MLPHILFFFSFKESPPTVLVVGFLILSIFSLQFKDSFQSEKIDLQALVTLQFF